VYVGSNQIAVEVIAQDTSFKNTYKITVTRESGNTHLDGLTLSSGTLSPVFAGTSNTLPQIYTASVANSVTFVTVIPTASDPTATITVNGTTVTSGTESGPITLNVGANTITTRVTGQDPSFKKTYTVTVTREPGSDNAVYQPVSVETPANSPGLADDGITVHPGVSPNGDGIDDFLQIDNIISYPDNRLMIMNRNGILVYDVKGYDNSSKIFDGHSNKTGQMQLPGTYFYSLDYTVKGISKHKTGFLVLKY
jgi:gliding motility-associated-like protein